MSTRNFLLISPYFPPMGVVGVKRALNLTRHLPLLGLQPVVLASPPMGEHHDEDLQRAIPEGAPVHYTFPGPIHRLISQRRAAAPKEQTLSSQKAGRTGIFGWDLQYITPLDRYILDIPNAVREGLSLIREHDACAIVVSADPFSALVVGHILSRKTGLPLVADLRDPWSANKGKMALRPPPTRAMVRLLEKKIFNHAAAIVLNTERCRQRYVGLYRGIVPEERFHCIRNSFDETVFKPATVAPAAIPTLVHFGRFRILFDPDPLLRAFRRLIHTHNLRPDDIRYLFVGGLRPRDRDLVAALDLEEYVDEEPFVPYRDALSVLASAHLLTMVVPPEYELQIPAKLYDYMAAGRPILALCGNGEVAQILNETGSGRAVPFNSEELAAEAMADLLNRHHPGEQEPLTPERERFSARAQARSFANLLNKVSNER